MTPSQCPSEGTPLVHRGFTPIPINTHQYPSPLISYIVSHRVLAVPSSFQILAGHQRDAYLSQKHGKCFFSHFHVFLHNQASDLRSCNFPCLSSSRAFQPCTGHDFSSTFRLSVSDATQPVFHQTALFSRWTLAWKPLRLIGHLHPLLVASFQPTILPGSPMR